jgi:hypothetical protein
VTSSKDFTLFASLAGMYLLLVLGSAVAAFKTEAALRFITSPRRKFTQRELSWTRWTAILGILCFSAIIFWLLFRFCGMGASQ